MNRLIFIFVYLKAPSWLKRMLLITDESESLKEGRSVYKRNKYYADTVSKKNISKYLKMFKMPCLF